MQKDDIINGYRILRDFTTTGGGLSKWTFAEKAGVEYFIKEFLSPKYPTEHAPGSPALKARKREACERFEAHHRALMERINASCGKGGNLVFTLDFFRWGATYYKVTEKVDTASVPIDDICRLPLANRLLILRTVTHSLQILHRAGIVHGDLKPENILIKQTKANLYTAKLIDFDNSYFAAQPPEVSEDLVGDMVFYAPEVAAYVQQDTSVLPNQLTQKADIFSLGLLFCLYLTGQLPDFPKKYHYPCLAVQQGYTLRLTASGLPHRLKRMVNDMLLADPAARPDIQRVFELLKGIRLEADYVKIPWIPPSGVPGGVECSTTQATKLKGTLLTRAGSTSADASTKKDSHASVLRGKGLGKDKGKSTTS